MHETQPQYDTDGFEQTLPLKSQVLRIGMSECSRAREVGIVFQQTIQNTDLNSDTNSICVDDAEDTVRSSHSVYR